jgi:hypothetical protein
MYNSKSFISVFPFLSTYGFLVWKIRSSLSQFYQLCGKKVFQLAVSDEPPS